MSMRALYNRVADLPQLPAGTLVVPPPELIAFTIVMGRGLCHWKKDTLAHFAGVSISTIERAERGEKVKKDSLDRIAEALGYGAGYFTSERPIQTAEQVYESTKKYANLVPVEIAPFRTEGQLRKLIRCHSIFPHCPEIDEELFPCVRTLMEWLDLAAFVTSDWIQAHDKPERRRIYKDIFQFIDELGKSGLSIATGVMEAPQLNIPDWHVAVIVVTNRNKDPGWIKRRYIFVDSEAVALEQPAAL